MLKMGKLFKTHSLPFKYAKKIGSGEGHPSYDVFVEARRKIALLNGAWAPSG